jgi:hypothetical protein
VSGLWFATHAAGFGPLVLRLAERDFPGSTPSADGDNALRLVSESVPKALLAYCRGLFRVLGEAPGGLAEASRVLAYDARVEAALGDRGRPARDARTWYAGSFVLRSFGPDDPAALPPETRRALELLVERRTGARPDSARPDREYRVQERADGRVLFLERITRPPEAQTRAGELPRSTCRLLAEMSEPRPDDIFLDPFCGYGGIVLERALAAPYRFAFAQDVDAGKVAAVKAALGEKSFEKRRRTIFPKARDALDGSAFEPSFVTAIATDPPWGLYDGGPGAVEAEALLRGFLAGASRLLAPGGRLVLLVSRSLVVGDAALALGDAFAQREALDVLVSGKKARALRFDRL